MATSKVPVLAVSVRSHYAALSADTDEARETVRQHLDRILGSTVFRNSRRYSSVLRFVVTKTLDGDADEMKERTIGVAVFGRAPDYDTTADHVVRSAIAEIRKRLAQYYQEDGCEDDLRIELLPGSYIPQFRLLAATEPDVAPSPLGPALTQPDPSPQAPAPPAWRNWKILAAAGILTAAAVAFGLARTGRDSLRTFWQPFLASSNPVLICVGDMEGSRHDPEPEDEKTLLMKNFHSLYTQNVHLGDAETLARIAGFLESRGAQFRVVSQSEATYTDLQTGPAVLIGLLNNDWTRRLVGHLGKTRFSIDQSVPERVFIRDGQDPSRNDWSYNSMTPYLDFTKDYSLVLRVVDPKTEQVVVVAGGISVFGTLAAGEFLTTPSGIGKLEAVAPRDWARKNFELVLSTDVIRGKPGHATIVASHFW